MKASAHHLSAAAGKTTLTGTYGPYRNNHRLKVIICMWLILAAILMLFSLLAPSVIDAEGQPGRNHPAAVLSRAVAAATITATITQFLCLPFYCLWVNRSCKNGWLLNPPKMRTTPGLAVGYYFIPVVSLWKPYVSMSEIRNASFGMSGELRGLLPIWWFFWVAFLMLTAGELALQLSANQEMVAMGNKLGTVADITGIVLSYLTIALVVTITNAQNKRASEWHA